MQKAESLARNVCAKYSSAENPPTWKRRSWIVVVTSAVRRRKMEVNVRKSFLANGAWSVGYKTSVIDFVHVHNI
jgi:ureidoglycolate hydrolase